MNNGDNMREHHGTPGKPASFLIGLVVVLIVLAIPAGIGLAIWYENVAWLILSVVAFIIMYAG